MLEDSSILSDCVMNLGLENLEEAILADLAACLWSFYNGFGSAAEGTQSWWHADAIAIRAPLTASLSRVTDARGNGALVIGGIEYGRL